jgi:hypothetical protein
MWQQNRLYPWRYSCVRSNQPQQQMVPQQQDSKSASQG